MGILRDMENRSKCEVVTDNTYIALEWTEAILIQQYYDSYKIKQASVVFFESGECCCRCTVEGLKM